MAEQPTVLIIDDDSEWLDLFREALRSHFHVEVASTVAEAQMTIGSKGGDIQIALVDLLLKDDKKTKQSGLDAMFLLRKQKIPCIVVTAYKDGKTIREAVVAGRASDVWFKTEDFVTLRRKIDDVLRIEGEKKTVDKQPSPELNSAENQTNSSVGLDAYRQEIVKYQNRLIVASILIAILLIILIFTIPYAISWGWMLTHPHRLGLQISFSLMTLGILWANIDTDEKRKWFAIGSIIIAAILTIAQII